MNIAKEKLLRKVPLASERKENRLSGCISIFFPANISNESCGISVIFTDEIGQSTFASSPPRRSRHGGLGLPNGKTTLLVPNGLGPAPAPPDGITDITSVSPGQRFLK